MVVESKKASEKKLQYIAEYDAKNTRQFKIKLHCVYDHDLIDYLDSKSNKQGTIKDALRAYINAEKNK